MTTTFVVREAKVFSKTFDTLSHLTPTQAQAMRADGFEVVFLYAQVVTLDDLVAATGAGLEVGFVMQGLAAVTKPTADLGSRMAHASIARLQALGVPNGITLFSDLEGSGHAPTDWIDYANAAGDATTGFGNIAGAYIGSGIGLTSAELFALRVHRYWKGGSQVKDRFGQFAEPSCGWCVLQGVPLDVQHPCGLQIDGDVCWDDFARRAVTVIAAAPPPPAVA